MKTFIIAASMGALSSAQQIGHIKEEFHLPLTIEQCTKSGGCTQETQAVTMDANWRWLEKDGQNCYDGNNWNTTLCPDPETCARNCGLEGLPQGDWMSTYGVKAGGDSLRLNFVTRGQYSTNVGSRVYLLDGEDKYKMFKLKNREFSFEVDVSGLPCGLNGALYFVSMEEDGGRSSSFSNTNVAGAKYGTGYCDAQCPRDIKFIQGEANVLNWEATTPNQGVGQWGACCPEMDIWEANSVSSSYTLHPCEQDDFLKCTDLETCGDNKSGNRYNGVCDKDGCDLNPYRAGVKDFYGPNMTVDTNQKFRIVTQFITSDGTDAGDLVEVRRLFTQNGKVIDHPMSKVDTMEKQYDSISDEMCDA